SSSILWADLYEARFVLEYLCYFTRTIHETDVPKDLCGARPWVVHREIEVHGFVKLRINIGVDARTKTVAPCAFVCRLQLKPIGRQSGPVVRKGAVDGIDCAGAGIGCRLRQVRNGRAALTLGIRYCLEDHQRPPA